MNNIQIGDIVKVKSWEELVDKYGLDEDGDIIIPKVGIKNLCFFSFQNTCCGKEFIVTEIFEGHAEGNRDVCGKYYDRFYSVPFECLDILIKGENLNEKSNI